MIKDAIIKIVSKEDLTYDEAYAVMNEIMSGETTTTQNAAFLAALSTKSARAETTDEIAGAPRCARMQPRWMPAWSFSRSSERAATTLTASIFPPQPPLLPQRAG